jgi:kynureninase
MSAFNYSLHAATDLDRQDPLAHFRERFDLPLQTDGRTPALYLCGNSLGPMPRAVRDILNHTLDDWATLGVRGHESGSRPWITYADDLAPSLATLVGADVRDVVLMNSLTVNLHLMMTSFYRPTATRHAILIERSAFPSDLYAVESQINCHGYDSTDEIIYVEPRAGEDRLRTEDILQLISAHAHRLALVLLPGVQYRTGQVLDIAAITAAGRRAGACVGWDLAHAIGNIPLKLAEWDADFAVWCSYKYLCGGPGAIAGAYVNARHRHAMDLPRFAGWWGNDLSTRFQMKPTFEPMEGAAGWQLSNPPILATAPLVVALALFLEAGIDVARQKSVALTAYAQNGIQALLSEHLVSITPDKADERGCQLSLRVLGSMDRARAVFNEMGRRGVIGDWRDPDVIRIAPHPLYNSFTDVARFLQIMQDITAVM